MMSKTKCLADSKQNIFLPPTLFLNRRINYLESLTATAKNACDSGRSEQKTELNIWSRLLDTEPARDTDQDNA